jgi:hypothetical protein
MPASRKTKRKEAAGESSRRGRSSLSLLLSDNDDEGESEAGPAVGGGGFEPQGVGRLLLLVIIVIIIIVINGDNGRGEDASVVIMAILILMLRGRRRRERRWAGAPGVVGPVGRGGRVQPSIVVCIAPFGQSDSGGVNNNNGKQGRQVSMFSIAMEMVAKAAVAVEYCSGMVSEGK